jgi:hypothetical protein
MTRAKILTILIAPAAGVGICAGFIMGLVQLMMGAVKAGWRRGLEVFNAESTE